MPHVTILLAIMSLLSLHFVKSWKRKERCYEKVTKTILWQNSSCNLKLQLAFFKLKKSFSIGRNLKQALLKLHPISSNAKEETSKWSNWGNKPIWIAKFEKKPKCCATSWRMCKLHHVHTVDVLLNYEALEPINSTYCWLFMMKNDDNKILCMQVKPWNIMLKLKIWFIIKNKVTILKVTNLGQVWVTFLHYKYVTFNVFCMPKCVTKEGDYFSKINVEKGLSIMPSSHSKEYVFLLNFIYNLLIVLKFKHFFFYILYLILFRIFPYTLVYEVKFSNHKTNTSSLVCSI